MFRKGEVRGQIVFRKQLKEKSIEISKVARIKSRENQKSHQEENIIVTVRSFIPETFSDCDFL